MRAARVLAARPERAILALAELCEERKEEDLVSPPPFVAPRLSNLPPQTPYTIGSQSVRPKGASPPDRFSPATQFFEPGPRLVVQQVAQQAPPDHMAPRRGKWTSPPPPEAPSADQLLFESQLGKGLEMATSSTEAREREAVYHSSSSNSEVLTDEDRSDAASDDVTSVRSYTEGLSSNSAGSLRRPSWHIQDTAIRIPQARLCGTIDTQCKSAPSARGRHSRSSEKTSDSPSPIPNPIPLDQITASKSEHARRSISGPPRALKGLSWSSATPTNDAAVPLPSSPESPLEPQLAESSTVFYQTTTTRSPRPTVLYPSPGSHNSFLSQYQTHHQYHTNPVPHDIFPANLPSLSSMNPRVSAGLVESHTGPETPTPMVYSSHHAHSHSTATITAPTPPPHASSHVISGPSLTSEPQSQRHLSHDPRAESPTHRIPAHEPQDILTSPQPSATTSNGSSPTPSSTGYATSLSRSPSPCSPSPPLPATAPLKETGDDLHHSPAFLVSKMDSVSLEAMEVGLQVRPDGKLTGRPSV